MGLQRNSLVGFEWPSSAKNRMYYGYEEVKSRRIRKNRRDRSTHAPKMSVAWSATTSRKCSDET